MKKISFKGRKHAITATCLLVGMFVLTSSVYANYDNAKGYTNYKDAVKQLAFYEENFSANGEITITIDGEVLGSIKGNLKLDGQNQFSEGISSELGGNEYRTAETIIGGKKFIEYADDNTYTERDGYGTFRGDMDMNDATNKKAIRFMELFADTMVGDLKNNFVLASSEGGNKSYSVNVAGSQIPEVINAGLSLMFTASNNADYSNTSYVTYEDHTVTYNKFYEEQTGKEATEEMYENWDDEIQKVDNDFYAQYQDVLASKNDTGIVYVRADGTYEYYKTYEKYAENVELDQINQLDIVQSLGNDPYIDSATCDFTLDEDGNLVSNKMSASMTGVDKSGEKHTITMTIDLQVSDYGTTTVDAFDTDGKERID